MKKLLFLLVMVCILNASCEGPPGRDGLSATETYWFVKTYTIHESQWQLVNGMDQLNSYFQARISVPELDRELYENGSVFCYMFQSVNGREVQTPLPFTNHYGEGNNSSEHLWTETYSYDFYPGSITFYVTYSDFYTSSRPYTTTFRVVLNY